MNIAKNPTQVRVQQGAASSSVVPIRYMHFVAEFVRPLLSMVETCLDACFLYSAEYGPCVGEAFERIFVFCYLRALYFWCAVSSQKYGNLEVSLSVGLMGQ